MRSLIKNSVRYTMLFLLIISCSHSSTKIAPIRQTNPLKIMPLGDSITQGEYDTTNYRPYLAEMLTHAGCQFEYVGSRNDGLNHEGHYGWRADSILVHIGAFARDHRPDIVLCHLGTNDLEHEKESPIDVVAQRTVQEISSIIDSLRAVNPRVVILVAEIIPNTSLTSRENFQIYNSRLRSFAPIKGTTESPVYSVDHYTGFDWNTDLVDAVHPNVSGARKMAGRWYQALQERGLIDQMK